MCYISETLPANSEEVSEADDTMNKHNGAMATIATPQTNGGSDSVTSKHDVDLKADNTTQSGNAANGTGTGGMDTLDGPSTAHNTEPVAKRPRKPLPTSRPKPAGTQEPTQQPTQQPTTQRRASAPKILTPPTFNPETAARVQQLHERVKRIPGGNPSDKWYEAEEELLELLRGEKLGYAVICGTYLPRHTPKACASHLYQMKKARQAD